MEAPALAHQFVVQLDNHPGNAAQLGRVLRGRGLEIQHVECFGEGPTFCMVVTPADDEAARGVIGGLGFAYIEGAPIVVEVEAEGGVADARRRLEEAGVKVTGTLEIGRRAGLVEVAFCVDSQESARRALGTASEHPAVVIA
jgi:hypothetical protein